MPYIVSHRARADGGEHGRFRAFIVHADILRELELISGVIKLRKICIFVVYSY